MQRTNKQFVKYFAESTRAFAHSANGTLHIEADELKSYNTVIARKLKRVDGNNFAWVSSERYSNTTSKHQGQVASALRSAGFEVLYSPVCPVNRVPSLRKAYVAQVAAQTDRDRKVQERADKKRKQEEQRVLAMPPQAKVERAESEGMPPSPPVAEPKFCNFDKAHGDKPAVAFDGTYDLCAQCADDLGVKYEKPAAPQGWTHAEA